MSTQQLFIPDRIKIGFQKREGTYTKKLAFIVYYDQKGVLRKEKSWDGWRDKKITPQDFDNTPESGFVLNKGVGGARQSYGWNTRNEYIRVYDPRDFEFEISVANLLFILRECDCSKGKGLEGKFVYAWSGTELVLLPERSQDYHNSKNFTKLQSMSIKSKELIAGASYVTKHQEILTYLGKFDYHFTVDKSYERRKISGISKKYVFINKNFVFLNDLKIIAALNSDVITSNYAELVDKYYKSAHGSKIVELFTKDVPLFKGTDYFVVQNGLEYTQYYLSGGSVIRTGRYQLTNNILVYENDYCYNNRIKPTTQRLYARLESGSEFFVISSGLKTEKEMING